MAGPELRLASLFDEAADVMLVVSADGGVLSCNRAGGALFGAPAREIVGRNVTALLAAPVQGDAGAVWADCIGDLRERRLVRMSCRDGGEFSAEVTVSTAPTSNEPQHLLVIRPCAAAGANAASLKSKPELTSAATAEEIGSALAHDLNQPLTAAMLYLQAIERAYERATDGKPLPAMVATILHKAVHETERASGMLQSMRRARNADGGRLQLCDVNAAVEDAIDLADVSARQGSSIDRHIGRHIDRHLAPRLPPVPVDRAELQQALISLIRGALDDARGRQCDGIRLTTGCERGHIAVVAETAVEKNGEMFGNCALSTNGRGNCERELAVARAIARSHGGDLVVDGEGCDRGARFTLRLPLPAETASSV